MRYSSTHQQHVYSNLEIYAGRMIAALFLAGAGVKMAPFAAAALVEHAVKLIRTEQLFLQSAGIDRLYYLTYFDGAKVQAIRCGAVQALLGTLERRGRGGDDASMLDGRPSIGDGYRVNKVLQILDTLSNARVDGDTGDGVTDDTDDVGINTKAGMTFEQGMKEGMCSPILRQLLYALDEEHFGRAGERDGYDDGGILASNFQLAKALYKDCTRTCRGG